VTQVVTHSAVSTLVRIGTVRSRNKGGVMASAFEVDAKNNRIDAKSYVVLDVPRWLNPEHVEQGQLLQVSGKAGSQVIEVNGFKKTETKITVSALQLVRPSGEHIITLLSEGESFAGIGPAKARKLWNHFGQDLYEVLDKGDVARLKEVLTPDVADNLVAHWGVWTSGYTVQWIQSRGFSVPLARKVLAYYGRAAVNLIEQDPYRLISFAGNWKTVDAMAQGTFKINADDPRRLAGAVEAALYGAFDQGDSCLSQESFKSRLNTLLSPFEGQFTLKEAIASGERTGAFLALGNTVHAPGPYLMETMVADAIVQRSLQAAPLLGDADLARLIGEYEAQVRQTICDPAFALNPKQREALTVANASPFAIITGGAGTGKTTVLRALFGIYKTAGYEIYAMALSGRAAKRIGEATELAARTIAGFLQNLVPGELPEQAVIVVDEASMVDLPSAWRVLRQLPAQLRIVFVGDPHQLAPVGPGLLLHELVNIRGLPVVELMEVRRHGGRIAQAAADIRDGRWPEVSERVSEDIAFLPCAGEEIDETVLRLCEEDRTSTQILCATHNARHGGTRGLNRQCQERFNAHGQPLMLWNAEYEQEAYSGFRVGDPVLCLKNDWEADLQNGSLGVLLSVEPHDYSTDVARVLGRIQWDDGRIREFKVGLLNDLDLAYAISIHKAQGSAFGRVIIPVTQSRLLDRSLLYTAVTRAQRQVILVGDMAAARQAVIDPRRCDARQVALGRMVQERLRSSIGSHLAKG
jgi:exodeoxyribonuclease V alpha subunit